jgi:hypothetical protein
MKTRNYLILIAVLCLSAFVLGSCEYWDAAEGQGRINITFDNSGSRNLTPTSKNREKTEMIYTITLTKEGTGEIITRETDSGDTAILIQVTEGVWNIEAEAQGWRWLGYGTSKVMAVAGKLNPVNITINPSGKRAHSLDDLILDLQKPEPILGDVYSIEIAEKIIISEGIKAEGLGDNIGFLIPKNKTIKLFATKDVSITREWVSNDLFGVKGTLILEGRKGSNLELIGCGRFNSSKAIIDLYDGGTLEMNTGVTLRDNVTGKGGGVCISNGVFFMYGGTISGNTSTSSSDGGGGVFIGNGGGNDFRMTGGIISGNVATHYGSQVYDERYGVILNDPVTKYPL